MSTKRAYVIVPAIAMFWIIGTGWPTRAEIVQAEFRAVIFEIFDPFGYVPPTLAIGDTLSGFYEYELGVADGNPAPEIGFYRYTIADRWLAQAQIPG